MNCGGASYSACPTTSRTLGTARSSGSAGLRDTKTAVQRALRQPTGYVHASCLHYTHLTPSARNSEARVAAKGSWTCGPIPQACTEDIRRTIRS